ncbi:hypothetical protein [Microbulbifer aggregans]|uniref:hypothetical protein n=1 Tax=Microbulbifer aggregans TaxID=1769779 RepID=UPI001CFE7570|nr:hypothetical protein [Microbulbifer aggregans]
MDFLVLFLSVAFLTTLSTLSGALLLRSVGIGVPVIKLGTWGPKATVRIAGSSVSISPWIFSGSVIFKDVENVDLYGSEPGGIFSSFGRIPRALMVLTGPAAMFVFAFLLMGVDAVEAFVSGFSQIFRGALSPFGYAQELLGSFWAVVHNSPVLGTALLASKLSAFAMLPIAPFSGGQALSELARPTGAVHGRLNSIILQVGILVMLVIVLSWMSALGYWLLYGGSV